jgi:hypothetical protein
MYGDGTPEFKSDEQPSGVNADLVSIREFADQLRALALELESVKRMTQIGDSNAVTAFSRFWDFQLDQIDPVNLSTGSFDDGRELSGTYKSDFYDPKLDHIARLHHALETIAAKADLAAESTEELDLEFEAYFKRILDDEM